MLRRSGRRNKWLAAVLMACLAAESLWGGAGVRTASAATTSNYPFQEMKAVAYGGEILPAYVSSGLTLYVSTQGDDDMDGTEQAPFRTLERARDEIRGLKTGEGLPSGGVTVYIRGGDYSLTDTFELSALDSGEPDKPIAYKGYPGEEVRLLGGHSIPATGLAEVTDPSILSRLPEEARGQVMAVDLTSYGLTEYGELMNYGHGMNYFPEGVPTYTAPELFYNGEAMTLARWPNEGYATVHQVADMGTIPRNYASDVGPDSPNYVAPELRDDPWRGFVIRYEGNRPARWQQAEDPWMYGFWYWDWSDQSVQIDTIDPGSKRITTKQPSAYGVRADQRYYVYNLLEEIDMPGEYYLDRDSGVLYLYPPVVSADASIQLSTLKSDLITITGASYIEFADLYAGTGRQNAFAITNSTGITLDGLQMGLLGGKAVMATNSNEVQVKNSDIFDTGSGGIVLQGGNRQTLTPGNNEAYNNHIYRFSRIAKTYTPAIQLGGVGNRATHNQIHDSPHVGLLFTGNDHVVEYNEIYNVLKEADDMGAIYTGRNWTFRGNVIRYNLIHSIEGIGGSVGAMGVYLDDAMSSAHVHGNIFYNVPRPVFAGGGRDHLIENNLMIRSSLPVRIDDRAYSQPDWAANLLGTLQRTLTEVPYDQEPWLSKYPKLASIYEYENNPGIPAGNVIRNNALIQSGNITVADKVAEYGVLEQNVAFATSAEAGIADEAGMDFRLLEDAPLLDEIADFQPIPADQIGLVVNEKRTLLPMPGSFALLEPEVNRTKVRFSWTEARYADQYRLLVAEDAAFTSVVVDQRLSSRSVQADLESGQTYYWIVAAALTGARQGTEVWNDGGVRTFVMDSVVGGQPWTPLDAGARLWLDASDASTLMTDESGRVSEWLDKTEYAQHAEQIDTARQPVYDETAGQVEFGGAEILKLPGSVFSFGSSQLFAVADMEVTGSLTYLIGSTFGSNNANSRLYLGGQIVNGAGRLSAYGGRNDQTQQDTVHAPMPQQRSLIGLASTDAPEPIDLTIRINGEQAGSKLQYTGAHTGSPHTMYIGGRSNSAADQPAQYGGFMQGTVHEVIATGELTAGDTLRLEGYLAHKWDMADRLPAAHPYKLWAPEHTDKLELLEVIGTAQEVYDDAVQGDQPGEYPEAAMDALAAAIQSATATAEDEHTTQLAVDEAAESLETAIEDFRDQVNRSIPVLLPLDDVLRDESGWDYAPGSAVFGEDGEVEISSNRTTIGYAARTFENEILQFRARMDLSEGWPAFALRAADPRRLAWENNRQYLLIIKEDKIELQRWKDHNAQSFLQIIDNDYFSSGQWHDIEFGAVNEGEETIITLRVDGVEAIRYVDTSPIQTGGYFSVYNFHGAANTLLLAPTVQAPPVPSGTLSAGWTTLSAGSELELTLGVRDASDGIVSLEAVFQYDPSQVSFATYEAEGRTYLSAEALESLQPQHALTGAVKPELGQIKVVLLAAGQQHAVTADGPIFKLHGQVRSDAAPGQTEIALTELAVSGGTAVTELDISDAAVHLTIVSADKSGLSTLIDYADDLYHSSVEGTEPGQYPRSARESLSAAIDAAIEVRDDAEALQAEVEAAVQALNGAITAFRQAQHAPEQVNRAELLAAIQKANQRYAATTGGDKLGNYPQSAREALSAAIATAQAAAGSSSISQSGLNQAAADLLAALDDYRTRIVTLVAGASRITILDLAIVAKHYGATSDDPEWSLVEAADLNDTGEITIEVLAAVARMILDDWLEQ